jgi:DNA-binding NtrC family response regulator
MSYSWPGNVRELENVIKRAVIIVKGDVIGFNDIDLKPETYRYELSSVIQGILDSAISTETSTDIFHCVVSSTEKILIEQALKITKGNQLQASALLGISRVTLRKKIHDYNITSG